METELIPKTLTWMARESSTIPRDDSKGIHKATVKVELIYGEWLVEQKKGLTVKHVIGEVFHILTGPTALRSIEHMADELNRRKFVPDGKSLPKIAADGWKQSFSEAGGDSLFDALTLKSTISYDPKKAKTNPF